MSTLSPSPSLSFTLSLPHSLSPSPFPTLTPSLSSRLLQMTVLFRTLSDGRAHCVSPPAVLRLPESAPGQDYHHAISPLLPSSLASSDKWTLHLTDGKVQEQYLHKDTCLQSFPFSSLSPSLPPFLPPFLSPSLPLSLSPLLIYSLLSSSLPPSSINFALPPPSSSPLSPLRVGIAPAASMDPGVEAVSSLDLPLITSDLETISL